MQRFITRARRTAHRVELCLTTWPAAHQAAFQLTCMENAFWVAISNLIPTKWVCRRCVTTAVHMIEWAEILQD